MLNRTQTIESKKEASLQGKVAIVVVSYNSGKDLRTLFSSLDTLSYQNFKIFLVDNCSSLEEQEQLNEFEDRKDLQLVRNVENAGFAAGNNLGIRKALIWQPDFIWLLNADTIVEPDALSSLMSAASKSSQVDCWGNLVCSGMPRDNATVWCKGGEIDLAQQEVAMRSYGESYKPASKPSSPEVCDYIPGCSMFFRPELIKKVGFMPEDYFMYFEETAWCAEMRRKGLTLAVDPNAIVWHATDDGKTSSVFHTYYYNRNQLKFWFRQSSLVGRLSLVFDSAFKKLPRALKAFYKAGSLAEKEIFKAHARANLDFLLCRGGRRI